MSNSSFVLKASTVLGVPPEFLAYALAKFSRSSATPETSFLAWLYAIPPDRPEKFFSDVFHNYGHASVADLAHAPLALENISIVAAIAALHDRRLDCQERSTRYMNFSEAAFVTPPELEDCPDLRKRYECQCEALFVLYRDLHATFVSFLSDKYADKKDEAEAKKAGSFSATIRARAFDLARYALPASTLTGVGMITSARVYMSLISSWLSSPVAEIRMMGQLAKKALVEEPADNYAAKMALGVVAQMDLADGAKDELRNKLAQVLGDDSSVLPTLMRHVGEDSFAISSRSCAREFAQKYLGFSRDQLGNITAAAIGSQAKLMRPSLMLDQIVVAIIFPETFGWRLEHIMNEVAKIAYEEKVAFLREIQGLRGEHDPVHEGWAGAGPLQFDIVIDNGAFRDLHRHRENIQFLQAPTGAFGCAIPPEFYAAGVAQRTEQVFGESLAVAQAMLRRGLPVETMQYVLPLNTNIPWLAVMHPRQLGYLTELRTKSTGHFSYRRVAWEMHQQAEFYHPYLTAGSKATPFEEYDPFSR